MAVWLRKTSSNNSGSIHHHSGEAQYRAGEGDHYRPQETITGYTHMQALKDHYPFMWLCHKDSISNSCRKGNAGKIARKCRESHV